MRSLSARGALVGLLVPFVLLSGCGEDDTTADDPAAAPSSEPSSEGTPPPTAEPTAEPTGPSDTASASPTVEPLPDWPACRTIWQEGVDLPPGYAGCLEGDTAVAAKGRACAFGLPLITYADSFYAIPDGRVNATAGAVAADPEYQAALASCQG